MSHRFSYPRRAAMTLLLLNASAAFGLTPESPASDNAHVVARFDTAVEAGFPFSIVVEAPQAAGSGGRARRATTTQMVVERRLAVDVHLPSQAQALMYAGRLGAARAVFTRGDDRLDVSLADEEGVRVIGYRAGVDDMDQHTYPAGQDADDDTPGLAPIGRTIGPNHVEDPLGFHPTFHLFIHNDLRAEEPAQLHSRFVAWWVDDLLTILPGERKLSLYYYVRVPWIADMDYQQNDVLNRFSEALRLRAPVVGLPYGKSFKHKFLLLTAHSPLPGVGGLAVEGQSEAVASVTGRLSVVAHEFGHTLGATHESAGSMRFSVFSWSDVLWRTCDTTMRASPVSEFSCLKYSPENERAIRSYLHHGPVEDRADRWLDRRRRSTITVD